MLTKAERGELQAAKDWAKSRPDITGVSLGFKYIKGKKTTDRCLVFTVKHKAPKGALPATALIPARFGEVRTDVVQATFQALGTPIPLNTRVDRAGRPLSHVGVYRPAPAGVSIGHVAITAGTFGIPVRKVGGDGSWFAVTNNHVAANSNDAIAGDHILQPGKHDGGQDPRDWWGSLEEFITINFPGWTPPGGKKTAVARAWWGSLRGIGNAGAWLTQCPYRMRVEARMIPQPDPNRYDYALVAIRRQDDILPEVLGLGPVQGVVSFDLGTRVQKVGRTTEHTWGIVEGLDASAQVSYGPGKVAQFDHQILIRGEGPQEFSAGGDSGSGVEDEQMRVGGLLYAGGDGITILNDVPSLLAERGLTVV